jgi:hypothetical protein
MSKAAPNTWDLFAWSDAQQMRERRQAFGELTQDYGPRGLLIRDPYATQILNGEKHWEIRGRATQIRGTIVIIKSGTGCAFGTANLKRVLGPLSLDDLGRSPELPAPEREEFAREGLPYPRTYAYVLDNPRWFETPVPYQHPSGAVTWVRLPELNLERLRYAAPADGQSQHGVG